MIFSRIDSYLIFEICGRALTFNVMTGQLVGGLIAWVPAALLESMVALLAMRQWLKLSHPSRLRSNQREHRRAALAAGLLQGEAALD